MNEEITIVDFCPMHDGCNSEARCTCETKDKLDFTGFDTPLVCLPVLKTRAYEIHMNGQIYLDQIGLIDNSDIESHILVRREDALKQMQVLRGIIGTQAEKMEHLKADLRDLPTAKLIEHVKSLAGMLGFEIVDKNAFAALARRAERNDQ